MIRTHNKKKKKKTISGMLEKKKTRSSDYRNTDRL